MMRVFAGWDHRQAEAAEVFAFSVRENASIEVSINPLGVGKGVCGLALDASGFKRVGVTSFSYVRFLVPWLCNFSGRAAFFDGCDMLCLGDVAELADFDMQGKPIAVVKHPPLPGKPHLRARSWTSMMLLDCGHPKLARWTPEYVETAPDAALMRLGDFADDEIGELPAEWNVLTEHVAAEVARLLSEGGDPSAPDFYRGCEEKIMHWSHLSDPNGGSWIDRSGSALWREWRDRWRATQ